MAKGGEEGRARHVAKGGTEGEELNGMYRKNGLAACRPMKSVANASYFGASFVRSSGCSTTLVCTVPSALLFCETRGRKSPAGSRFLEDVSAGA